MIGDVPTFVSASASNTSYGLGQADGFGAGGLATAYEELKHQTRRQAIGQAGQQPPLMAFNQAKEHTVSVTRRLVQVIIVDPNENIPLEDCILHRGEEKLTDLNDQELFFEVDIKELLANHNEKRIKVLDKKVKERKEYLEPAKVRDLKMVVVTVAQF